MYFFIFIYSFCGKYLTENQKKSLKNSIDNFISTYNMDLVIVTKKDYNFNLMKDYAMDFYDYNKFGTDNVKSGIILFYNVDSEGPAVWISTIGKAILYYDDARIKSMKESMSSVKSKGHYNVINTFIVSASSYAKQGIPDSNKYAYIDEEGNYKIDNEKRDADLAKQREEQERLEKQLRDRNARSMLLFGMFAALIISGIVVGVFINKNKTIKREKNASIYLDNSSIKIYNLVDKFVGTHTSKTYIGSDDSSSGGGHSHSSSSSSRGGSSTSTGSSGTCHGGGGGRL